MSASSEPLAEASGGTSAAYRRYVLILLTAVYTFNFVDRQIIGILAPAIKADLNLSDSQLGILGGFAFAVLYTTLGIPIARIADRVNRVSVVTVSLALWSGFTALSGFAQGFVHLAAARVGVGIGEAGGSPPAHSILSDLYPKERRAGALAVYSMGIPIGITMAYLAGGWVLTNFSWRMTYFAVGLPGILLALLLKATVREPTRGAADGLQRDDPFSTENVGLPRTPVERMMFSLSRLIPGRTKDAAFRELAILWRATKHLLSIPTYRGIVIGLTAGSFASYALGHWIVVFFRRIHPSLPLPTVLLLLGLTTGTAYVIGVYFGGRLVDRRARMDRSAYGYIPAIALSLNIPCFLGAMWVSDPYIAMALFWPVHLLIGFYLGPCFALAQTLAPVSIRALSTAVFFFILNMIALGGGPTFVGFMSDYLAPTMGAQAGLRVALSSVVIALVISIVTFVRVAKTVDDDWAAATGDARRV